MMYHLFIDKYDEWMIRGYDTEHKENYTTAFFNRSAIIMSMLESVLVKVTSATYNACICQ